MAHSRVLQGFGYGSLVVVGFFCAVFGISKWKHSYWKRKRIPYVPAEPFLGSLMDIFKAPRHEIEMQRYNTLGRIHGYYEGNDPFLTVAEPDLLEKILKLHFRVFPERKRFRTGDKVIDKMPAILYGDDWQRVRKILVSPFSIANVERMWPIFKECAELLMFNFKTSSKGGNPVDLKKMYGEFTMDVIASAAFSTKLNSHTNKDNEFTKYAMMIFDQVLGWKLALFMLAPWLVRWLGISMNPPEATGFFRDTALRLIEERKNGGVVRDDFLQLLVNTRYDDVAENKVPVERRRDIDANYVRPQNESVDGTRTSSRLTEDEMVSQCTVFFLAGYDTTSSTLAFATYLLAMNMNEQDRLREEVDRAVRENNCKLTHEAVESMTYLDNVISETLRLYPPVFKLERRALTNFQLGDIEIPEGMIVNVPIFAMHRDPEFFPDPERFHPDRFTDEVKRTRPEFCYLPFGSGGRMCIGLRFALMEIKVCLSYVIASFRIVRGPETKENIPFDLGQHGILQPKDMLVRLEARRDSPLRLTEEIGR